MHGSSNLGLKIRLPLWIPRIEGVVSWSVRVLKKNQKCVSADLVSRRMIGRFDLVRWPISDSCGASPQE
jgi:hypothetical protein